MIVGLGTDIVDTQRIRAAHDRFRERFLEKVLTGRERALLPSAPVPYIAGRFAAKEAAVKALGTGFSLGISLQHIEVLPTPLGQPCLYLHGPAQERAQKLGVRTYHMSISHDRTSAVAVVLFEG